MKRHLLLLKKMFISLLCSMLFSTNVVANSISGDTITELRLQTIDSRTLIFNLHSNPSLTFEGDSIILSTNDTTLRFCQSYITNYYFVKRITETNEDSTICQNMLPLVWNGITFTESGTYTILLPSAIGGDSTVNMTLHVIPTTFDSVQLTIVENLLPYSFEGHTYTSSVINDTIVLTSISGCDSIIVFSLTVHNNVHNYLSDTICEDELPYIWNEHTFYGAGTAVDTLMQTNGADSIVHMTLITIPSTHINIYEAISESDLPFTFADRVYHSTTVDTLIFQNSFGCDSIVYLHLTVTSSTSTIIDSTVCESLLPITWNDSIFIGEGIKQTSLLSSSGLDSVVVMILHVIPTKYTFLQDTVLEDELPLSFMGHTYHQSCIDTIITLSAEGCDSIIYYHLTVLLNTHTYIDSIVCEYELPILWNGLIFNEPETKSIHYPLANGSDSIITMTLTVIPTKYGEYFDTITEDMLPYTFLHHVYYYATDYDTLMLTSTLGCDSVLTFHLYVLDSSLTGISTVTTPTCRITYNRSQITIRDIHEDSDVLLYTIEGRILERRHAAKDTMITIQSTDIPSGVYLIRVNNQVYKIVKI